MTLVDEVLDPASITGQNGIACTCSSKTPACCFSGSGASITVLIVGIVAVVVLFGVCWYCSKKNQSLTVINQGAKP
jgi:cobalamin biosynthesis Mg chelatase CobN